MRSTLKSEGPVKKPKLDAFRALQTVLALAEAKPEAFRADAVLALLGYYFTAMAPDETSTLLDDPKAYAAVVKALSSVPKLDAAGRERYFFDVVIAAHHDTDLRQLCVPLLDAYDDRTLVDLLTRALTDNSPLHQRNVLAVFDYMKWSAPERLVDPALQAKLAALAKSLERSRDPTVAGVARSFRA